MSNPISSCLAVPIDVEIGGKPYRVRLVDQNAKAQLERICERRARDQVFRDKDTLTDLEFGLAYGAFIDKVAGGDFAFGGPVFRRFIETPDGSVALVKVLFSLADAEASALATGYPVEATAAVRQVFAISFPQAPATV